MIFTVYLDLLGDYQSKNILTALGAIDLLNRDTHINISKRAMLCGCRDAGHKTGLNGRWQVLSNDPLTVCDTGHNEHGLKFVCNQIKSQQFDNLYMVVGFVNDKDLKSVLPILPKNAHYIFTQAKIARALPAIDLCDLAMLHGLKGEVVEDIPSAVSRARELARESDMIFIGGSTFTVAEAL